MQCETQLTVTQFGDVKPDNNMDLGTLRVPKTQGGVHWGFIFGVGLSYREMLQRNNPNLCMEMREKPIWCSNEYDDVSEDNEPLEEEDCRCPTILLIAQEQRMLREP